MDDDPVEMYILWSTDDNLVEMYILWSTDDDLVELFLGSIVDDLYTQLRRRPTTLATRKRS
jgi:hypothetical protein